MQIENDGLMEKQRRNCKYSITRVYNDITMSCPWLPPLTISGAMYSIVPQNEYALAFYQKKYTQKEQKKKNQ